MPAAEEQILKAMRSGVSFSFLEPTKRQRELTLF